MLHWMGVRISIVLAFSAIIIIASGQTMDMVPINKTSPPNLESVLYQLSQSSNPAEFASNHGIYMNDSRVRVIIELKNQSDIISSKFNITIEAADKNLVQALVPVSSLIDLAKEPYVKFIRAPLKPQVEASRPQITKTANSDSFHLSVLGIGASLFFLNRKHRERP